MNHDICVIGGCGHVGLPLAICFADKGQRVAILDVDQRAISLVSSGRMPFKEEGADDLLRKALSAGLISCSTSPEVISNSRAVILVLGTPVDAHLNPSFADIIRVVRQHLPHFRDGQLVVLRSTVYPGTSEKIDQLLKEAGLSIDIAFCPERIAEGHAISETHELPQIVSGATPEALRRARELFSILAGDIVELSPMEAELAKLFTNAWRYIKFAIANQFYSIANDHGLDYYKIHQAMTHNYPRAKDLPRAGFAAGPCLFKDTMQLAAFSNNSFFLGHAAMLVNEGQPAYIVDRLRQSCSLHDTVVGILGMAFKGDSDDPRESLAYKLRKILEIECKEVLITDPYVPDERIISSEEVISRSDVLILGAPHKVYKELDLKDKPIVDIWNFFGKGGLIP